MKNHKQRKQYFLPHGSQPMLIIKTYLVLFFIILVSGIIFYFIGNKSLSIEYFRAHSTIKTTMELLLPMLIVVNVIGLLGAAVLVIIFTHSIAGPIHQIKRISKEVIDGNFTIKAKFRKRDIINDLADTINQMIEGLNVRFKKLKIPIDQGKKLLPKIIQLEQLSQKDRIDLKKDMLEMINDLDAQIKEIKH